MSDFFLADRIKEVAYDPAKLDFQLAGAVNGFSGFGDFFASGDVVYYAATDGTRYEVGSGVYKQVGSSRVLTRNPFRSSNINVGPWYVNATSNSGPTDGDNGYFYPLWLTRSAAQSGVGFSDGPYTAVMEHTFDEIPGITFYMPAEHQAHGVGSLAGSGANYYDPVAPSTQSGVPVAMVGTTEIFVTYPGKTAVFNTNGIDSTSANAKQSGVAFWLNENVLSYDSNLVWDQINNRLGIDNSSPTYAVDVGGDIDYSIIRASGFIDGGSGVRFSGGAMTYTGETASGGVQLEPFLRNEVGNNSADGIIALSGDVNQFIDFAKQAPATIFAGPISGYCGNPYPCEDDWPTFRLIDVGDLPISDIRTEGGFVTQENAGIDFAESFPFRVGQIALYESSGYISYASGLYYDASSDRLGLGGNSVDGITPLYTLDVSGVARAASGIFNRILYLDNNIRIGNGAGNDNENSTLNSKQIAIGESAGYTSSGTLASIFVGFNAGNGADLSSGVVALGSGAAYNSLRNINAVVLGYKAGIALSGVSNVVLLGSRAGNNSKDLSNVILIGDTAGSGAAQSDLISALGPNAFVNASGNYNVVAIGRDAAKGASGLTNTCVLGWRPASGSFDFNRVVGIGEMSAGEASGVSDTVAIGKSAARYAETFDNVIAIGSFAAQSGFKLERTVAIGGLAASQASGSFNVYIGQDAGIAVSGYENIEIVASGSNESFLGVEASGKINIGNTIVGDVYTGRVAVGRPDDATPSGTLFIRPKLQDDEALVIQHTLKGDDDVPLVALKSGDATTFFRISNSGDVVTSGYMEPSGGLLLPSLGDPFDWMNSTTYKLYNEGGTLKWNGTALAMGGGFSDFDIRAQVDNVADSGSTITTGQTVSFSGINGAHAFIDSGNRQIIFNTAPLSGYVDDVVQSSPYAFYVTSSGEEGANRNEPMVMYNDYTVAFSGVSGISIDFSNLDDGTNGSGLFVIGYDTASSYNWSITNGNQVSESVLTTETVTISGVSGIELGFDPATNFFRVGASGLSGVLQGQIDSNVSFLSNENGPILVSGVSGIAAYASGQVELISAKSATSGIIIQDDVYIMDPQGSGNLAELFMGVNVRIGQEAGAVVLGNATPNSTQNYVAIGQAAGSGAQNLGGSVSIGYKTDANSDIDYGTVARKGVSIGWGAGAGCSGESTVFEYGIYNVNIGSDAGASCSEARYNVNIGQAAGSGFIADKTNGNMGYNVNLGTSAARESEFTQETNSIGYFANSSASGITRSNTIGYNAGRDSVDIGFSSSIGMNSTRSAFGLDNANVIGHDAAFEASGLYNPTLIGYRAGYQASGTTNAAVGFNGWSEHMIGIGTQSLEKAVNTQSVIGIGEQAGYAVSGTDNSILLGFAAGWKRSGSSSIIISNKSTAPTNYDLESWTAHSDVNIINIGDVIQGDMTDDASILHIGRALDDTEYFAGKSASDRKRDLDGLANLRSTVILSASNKDDSSLLLLPNSNASDPGQNSSLLKTLPSDSTNVGIGGRGNFNEIISSEGYLTIPVATAWNNSSKEVSTDTGAIQKIDGAMAIGDGTLFGTSAGANLVIYYNGKWHRVAMTQM